MNTPNENKASGEKDMNVAIAKALGWREIEVEELMMHFPGGYKPAMVKRWTNQPESGLILGGIKEPPAFTSDANTRPEMLASLTITEKWNLVTEVISQEGLIKAGLSDFTKLLELDQPTFAALFCEVKGLL